MYQNKFETSQTAAQEGRDLFVTAFNVAEEWHSNEEIQHVIQSWSIEEDDKGRTFYYHQATGMCFFFLKKVNKKVKRAKK